MRTRRACRSMAGPRSMPGPAAARQRLLVHQRRLALTAELPDAPLGVLLLGCVRVTLVAATTGRVHRVLGGKVLVRTFDSGPFRLGHGPPDAADVPVDRASARGEAAVRRGEARPRPDGHSTGGRALRSASRPCAAWRSAETASGLAFSIAHSSGRRTGLARTM